MKMKELTLATGLSDRTIRYYIDHDVFRPEKRSKNYAGRNSYDFTENDVRQLEQIVILRKYDFSLKVIKTLLFENGDIGQAVTEQIGLLRKQSDTQSKQIDVLTSVEALPPKTVTELCQRLEANNTGSDELPSTDVQSPYKQMYEKIIKKDLAYILFFFAVIGIILLMSMGEALPDTFNVDVKKESVPEGTAYISLLFRPLNPSEYVEKADGSKIYDFNDNPITFSEDSEIYNYEDEGGYVSADLHYFRADPLNLSESSDIKYYYGWCDSEILLWHKYFKIAYVSAQGEVLAVTNVTSIGHNNSITPINGFKADGTKLKTTRNLSIYFPLAFTLLINAIRLLQYVVEKGKREIAGM